MYIYTQLIINQIHVKDASTNVDATIDSSHQLIYPLQNRKYQ